MKLILLDFFQRRPWFAPLLGIGMALLAIMGLAAGDAKDTLSAVHFCLALFGAWSGPSCYQRDLQNGAYDVARTLPVTRRQLSFVAWLLSVVLFPLAIFVTVLPMLTREFVFGSNFAALLYEVIVRVSTTMGFAAFFVIAIGAAHISRRTEEPASSILATISLLCMSVAGPLAVWFLMFRFIEATLATKLLLLIISVLAVLASYPAVVAILSGKSSGYLWQAGATLTKKTVPRKFPPRLLGVGVLWIGFSVQTAAIGLCGLICVLYVNEPRIWRALIAGLACGTVISVFTATLPVLSIKFWRTLPLTSRRLSPLLLSFPLVPLAAVTLIVLVGAVLAGYPGYVFAVTCVVSAVAAVAILLVPLYLKLGYDAQVLMAFFGMLLGGFGYIFIRDGIPTTAFLAALPIIPVSYVWLCRLIECDSQMYRRMAQYSQRWRGWR